MWQIPAQIWIMDRNSDKAKEIVDDRKQIFFSAGEQEFRR